MFKKVITRNICDFVHRHIGPRDHDIVTMLNYLGFKVTYFVSLYKTDNLSVIRILNYF